MDDWRSPVLDGRADVETRGLRLASGRTPEAEILTELFSEAFRLRAALERRGNEMTRGLRQTCSRWQVLRAVHERPGAIPQIARRLGLTRQAVQRLADLLVEARLAMYYANPAHLRSPRLRLTPRGEAALQQIEVLQARWSNRMANGSLRRDLEVTLRTLRQLIDRLERTPAAPLTRRVSRAR
jgi:DNA-binding MarR family transcriptional regulator